MHAKAVRRSLAATLVSALAAGALVLGTGGAEADVLGPMEVSPATGTDTSGITLTTPAACPAPATDLIVAVRGSGFGDGTVLGGATGRTRTLGAADHAHKTACRATASNSTGRTVSTSPAVTVALGPALKNTTRPSIAGTHRVGYRQTARPGTWRSSTTSYSHVWKRDGRAIRGATRSTYVPTRADRGHRLTVTATAKRAGYAEGTATSASVRIG